MSPALTETSVRQLLEGIRDPCLKAAGMDLSIVDLGLIGAITVRDASVELEITFTEAGCMFTHRIIAEIQDLVTEAGADQVTVTPRWAPAWTESRLSARGTSAFREIRTRYPETLSPAHVAGAASRMDTGTLNEVPR